MNIFKSIRSAVAAGALSAAFALPASAQVTQVKPEEGSKHFAAVAKHLELGGIHFSYNDVDGDLDGLAKIGDRFLTLARKDTPGIPKGLSAAKIIDALGLNSVKAIGMSTRAIGKDLYHNRALLYMPDGPKGLLKLTGGKPSPLQIAAWAPADTGAALQMEVDLSTLLETVEAVIKATGDEQALGPFRLGIALPVPGLGMSVGELIGKLDARVMVALRLDESKHFQIPGVPIQMPGLQMMIAADDVDFLMTPLLAAAEASDEAVVEKSDDSTIIRMNSSLPGELAWFKPGVYHDKKAKRIIFTSHLDMAKASGKGDTLAGNEAFKKAMTGLPAEANGLTYATPQFMKAFGTWYKDVIEEATQAGGVSGTQIELINLIWEVLAVSPDDPIASVYANVPEGLLFSSNTNTTHKWTMAQVGLVPVVMAAAGFGAYQSTMERGRLAERAADEVRKAKKTEENPEAPEKAVKNNLQQIVFSAQTWFMDHPGEKEVAYETLVKNELIFELDPVSGESYQGLTLKRAGGEVSVKLKDGGSVAHKYQAVTD